MMSATPTRYTATDMRMGGVVQIGVSSGTGERSAAFCEVMTIQQSLAACTGVIEVRISGLPLGLKKRNERSVAPSQVGARFAKTPERISSARSSLRSVAESCG